MAITGYDIPQMLKEMTPQSEAKLRLKRRVGSMANMKTPSPCAPMMPKNITSSIVGRPQWQGKWSTP